MNSQIMIMSHRTPLIYSYGNFKPQTQYLQALMHILTLDSILTSLSQSSLNLRLSTYPRLKTSKPYSSYYLKPYSQYIKTLNLKTSILNLGNYCSNPYSDPWTHALAWCTLYLQTFVCKYRPNLTFYLFKPYKHTLDLTQIQFYIYRKFRPPKSFIIFRNSCYSTMQK